MKKKSSIVHNADVGLKAATKASEVVYHLSTLRWIKVYDTICRDSRKPKVSDLKSTEKEIMAHHNAWLKAEKGTPHGLSIEIDLFFANKRLPAEMKSKVILPVSLSNTGFHLGEENEGGRITTTLPPVATLKRDTSVPVMGWLDLPREKHLQKPYSFAQQLYIYLATTVPTGDREMGYYPLRLTVRDIAHWLWPKMKTGEVKYKKARHLAQIQRALSMANRMWVLPIGDEHHRYWSMFNVYHLPSEDTSIDAPIHVTVFSMPDSHHGPMVLRADLAKWVEHSVPWRVFLRLQYFWDLTKQKHGIRNPLIPLIRDKKNPDKEIRNPEIDKVPALSRLEIAQLGYGHTAVSVADRRRMSDHVKDTMDALEALTLGGDIVVEEVDGGTRILPTWNPTK